MKNGLITRILGFLFLLIFLSGCSTMMTVKAVDPVGNPVNGATVFVDDEKIGETPDASTKVSNFVGSSVDIRVTAEGFYTKTTEPRKEFKTGAFIGGLFILPMFLWVWGPKAEQVVLLSPQPQDADLTDE